jgi:S-methylmethionine-dependent homocysteine/selenocysteine methylase
MPKYRSRLPQLGGQPFLTDGGLETTLIFHEGWKLPMFESFTLLNSEKGRKAILDYYDPYIAIARRSRCGFVLEAPSWRANLDWGAKLGYDRKALELSNRASIALMERLRMIHETEDSPMPISGCIGPRGDGYQAGGAMTVHEAQTYHAFQADIFADAEADLVTAMTMTNVNEAIGITRAAQDAGLPVVISFTLETDGRLPNGDTLMNAVRAVDAATRNGPAYYMINCAHPTHFAATLDDGGSWLARVRGIRANASRRSHTELDESPDLDAGDPVEFGLQYRDILSRHPQIRVLGGCCGTDHRHVEQIGLACLEVA